MAPFDVEAARSKFPALAQDQVFFDNAGGSQTLGPVIQSIQDYLSRTNVQLGATYKTGLAATSRFLTGQAAGAKYINAQQSEIVYGPSTTQLFRTLSYTLQFQEGDEIVVSGVDHEANIAPWVDLAARQGLVLKWWRPEGGRQPPTNPKLLPDDLKGLLSPRTRLVTCTHASNVLGTVTDVRAVAEAVHAVPGALLCVDAVAYAPHRPVDVKELGVDFYAFSWYKVYGPHVSMLYASSHAQESMRSLGHFFNPHETLENKIGLAGASYELVQSIPAIAAYLEESSWDQKISHESALQSTLLGYLTSKPDTITVYGEPDPDTRLRVSTVSFRVAGWGPRQLVEAVEGDTNFGFRWGAFYSNRLVGDVLGLELDGVVRVSMVHYNTLEEVKGFIAALDKVISKKA